MQHSKIRIPLLTHEAELAEKVKTALADLGQIVEVREAGLLRPLLKRGAGLVAVDADLPASLLEEGGRILTDYRHLPVLVLGDAPAAALHHLSRSSPLEESFDPAESPEELARRVEELLDKSRFLQGHTLVGRSPAMQELRQRILQIAPTPMTVLITGESGTGKGEVASALHRYSPRRDQLFRAINCAAIPETLLENELFGHEKGAFTDAKTQSRGLFEQADGGTVFLDEIGEMALMAQVRLLRVLEQHEITRIGGSTSIPVDIRVLAASNKDLQQAMRQDEFRLDLYYRLKVVELALPPLRQRPEDIPLLIQHFVDELSQKQEVRFGGFSPAAMDLLLDYRWPGNVRELHNVVEQQVFLGPRGQVAPEDLLPHLEAHPGVGTWLPVPTNKTPDQSERELIYFALLDLKREVSDLRRLLEERRGGELSAPASARPVYPLEDVAFAAAEPEPANPVSAPILAGRPLQELEKEAIEQTLELVDGKRQQAAKILGIGVRTLYRKLDEYGLK